MPDSGDVDDVTHRYKAVVSLLRSDVKPTTSSASERNFDGGRLAALTRPVRRGSSLKPAQHLAVLLPRADVKKWS